MLGKAISHYRVTARLGAGGRIQSAAVSSHADQNGVICGSASTRVRHVNTNPRR